VAGCRQFDVRSFGADSAFSKSAVIGATSLCPR
jgi:hypothetical protein